nr:aminoacyl-tRNA hydrolase [Tissierella sp.]
MYVVVGLGNPGKDYTNTRHNIGFNTVDHLAESNNIKLNKVKFKAVYGEGNIGEERVLLVKPQTYMNNSGIAVSEIVRFYKLGVKDIIVIVDDIDIDFASVRIKAKGSAGSHNGLKSIIAHLKDQNFPRVKIGIGKKHPREDLANFVLSNFAKKETPDIEEAINDAARAVETIITHSIDEAMNQYNKK